MTTVGTKNETTRDAWVRQQLRALPAGWRILDAGGGEQPYRDACAHLDYVAQDFGSYDPKQQDTGLQMPPEPVMLGMLYGVWFVASLAFAAILAGVIF